MKNALSIIMVMVMCLSLCACGKNNVANVPSKDELMASVEEFDLQQFREDCNGNLPKAQKTYIGKVFQISGFVKEIQEDCCILDSNIVVPLSSDELMNLSAKDCISVVGRVSDVTHEEETKPLGLGTYTDIRNILTMDVAYYLGQCSSFRAEVVYMSTNGGLVKLLDDLNGRYCGLGVSMTQAQVDGYKYGDIVTVEGSIIQSGNSKDYRHAGEVYHAYLNIPQAEVAKN